MQGARAAKGLRHVPAPRSHCVLLGLGCACLQCEGESSAQNVCWLNCHVCDHETSVFLKEPLPKTKEENRRSIFFLFVLGYILIAAAARLTFHYERLVGQCMSRMFDGRVCMHVYANTLSHRITAPIATIRSAMALKRKNKKNLIIIIDRWRGGKLWFSEQTAEIATYTKLGIIYRDLRVSASEAFLMNNRGTGFC